MEASAIQAPAGLARNRTSLGTSLLRLRSDDQLVALFRAGDDEAFHAIYDRYKQRMFAYTRQMLSSSRPDAEDALQDIFMRAYVGLRSSDRELSLRPWLYRIAHNRCVDELRRPLPPSPEVLSILRTPLRDPTVEAEQRESLRRLIEDVRRLPDQQRSALLMRELGGVPYADVAAAIGVSVPAVKSLLVRARIGLAEAAEARDTACVEIQEALVLAHDRGVRPSGQARRHMHDCAGCRAFRKQLRGTSRQLAALAPTLGPLGVLAKLLGVGGGATGGAAAAGSGAGAAGATAAASGGLLAGGLGHVTALIAAAVVTAGGAVELQHTISAGTSHLGSHRATHRAVADGAAVAPEASVTNPVTASASTPAAARRSAPVTTNRESARPSAKVKLATGGPTPARQSSNGGAASAGALSSGGADASGGSSAAVATGTSLGSTSTSASGSTSTGDGTGTGSPTTGSSTGLGSPTPTTGTSGSPGTPPSTTGSTGSGPGSTGLGSSSGSSTPGQPAQAPITRLSL